MFSRANVSKALAVALLVPLVACGTAEEKPGGGTRTIEPPTTGPYVSVAVDNHFHDIHPEDDVHIAGDRSLVFKNQGSNTHNVTLVEAGIDRDIAPGDEFSIGPPLTDRLETGTTYIFFCKYHPRDQMLGRFTVSEPQG